MSDDIVTRLRGLNAASYHLLCNEAADEIERLRTIIMGLYGELMRHEKQDGPCNGTIDCECGISKIIHIVSFREMKDDEQPVQIIPVKSDPWRRMF